MPGPADDPAASPPAGLFNSLQRLLGTLLEIAQVRLDLLSAALEREKLRIFDGLLWGAVALLFIGLGAADAGRPAGGAGAREAAPAAAGPDRAGQPGPGRLAGAAGAALVGQPGGRWQATLGLLALRR